MTALLLATPAFAFFAMGACSTDNGGGAAGVVVNDIGQCGTTDDAGAGKFPHSALPTGQSCTSGTTCHMPIDDCASDWSEDPVGPNLDEYECLCTKGAWGCTLAIRVNTECGGPLDAGTDASLGAGDDAPVDSPPDSLADSLPDAPFDAPDGD